MVTAYDYPSGRIADAAGAELVLVGDHGRGPGGIALVATLDALG